MGGSERHSGNRRGDVRDATRAGPDLTVDPGAGIPVGAVASPNIWFAPDTYELENDALDPDGLIDSTLESLRSFEGATVLDIGCGTGYHLPRLAEVAERVIGVEPHPALAARARERVAALPNVEVRSGLAQELPVTSATIDIATARWAYFFGPGCEPGLRELDRVVRRGGMSAVVDVDATTSTFGRWFRLAHPDYDPSSVDAFFSSHGWSASRLNTRLAFDRLADAESVLQIEFPNPVVEQLLPELDGLARRELSDASDEDAADGVDIDYAVVVRHLHR